MIKIVGQIGLFWLVTCLEKEQLNSKTGTNSKLKTREKRKCSSWNGYYQTVKKKPKKITNDTMIVMLAMDPDLKMMMICKMRWEFLLPLRCWFEKKKKTISKLVLVFIKHWLVGWFYNIWIFAGLFMPK